MVRRIEAGHLHLATQALVKPSYAAPCDTSATNVLGTAHVLDSVRNTPSVRAVVVVTTDKVYENLEKGRPFVEGDRLGGHDPYSASKACAEILVARFRRSFFEPVGSPTVVTARAGNVIGGEIGLCSVSYTISFRLLRAENL